MHDRRRVNRWKVDRNAQVKFDCAGDFYEAKLLDINFKGLQVCLKEKLPLDQTLKLNISLDKESFLEAEAWVSWHRPVDDKNIYGLCFTRIRDSEKEKIYKYMCSGSPQQIKKLWWGKTNEGGGEMRQLKPIIEDKRIFARFAARIPIKFLDVNSDRQGEALTYDVSAKGLGIVASKELAPRTALEMWLNLPDNGAPLYTRGEVIWSRPLGQNEFRTGICFEKADLMGLSRVLRVI